MAITREKQIVLIMFKIDKARAAGQAAHQREMLALTQFTEAQEELKNLGVDDTTIITPWEPRVPYTETKGFDDVMVYALQRIDTLRRACIEIRARSPFDENQYSKVVRAMDELNLLVEEFTG